MVKEKISETGFVDDHVRAIDLIFHMGKIGKPIILEVLMKLKILI